jgi:hypothetical protein
LFREKNAVPVEKEGGSTGTNQSFSCVKSVFG